MYFPFERQAEILIRKHIIQAVVIERGHRGVLTCVRVAVARIRRRNACGKPRNRYRFLGLVVNEIAAAVIPARPA